MDAARKVLWPKFTRFRGDTKRLSFVLTDDRGGILRPSEHTLFLNVDGADGGPLIQKLSTVGGFATIDDAAGQIEVELLPADDALLADATAYDGVIVAVHTATNARHRGRFTLTLVDGLVDEPVLTIPTIVVSPASPYLTAEQIEANRFAAEAAAAAAEAARAQTEQLRDQVLADNSDARAYADQRLAALRLGDLSDVAITTPQDGNQLSYRGPAQRWENSSVTDGGFF